MFHQLLRTPVFGLWAVHDLEQSEVVEDGQDERWQDKLSHHRASPVACRNQCDDDA